MQEEKRLLLLVVSDATGATAQSVATSVLVQYTGVNFEVRRFPFTRSKEQVDRILEGAPGGPAVLVYTLVSEELRAYLALRAAERGIAAVDVLGPLMARFSRILERSPTMEPGAYRREEDEMLRLAEAIHYTLSHDDGLGLDTLHEADLVILGVSRTGKTPTSIYLSCRKLRVANIPIVKDRPLPEAVRRLPMKKVGFRMSVERLSRLRAERVGRMACAQIPGYSSKGYILEELEYCERLYRTVPGLWTVDVTNRSIEETSEWITRNVL